MLYKKITALITGLVMALAMLPAAAFAYEANDNVESGEYVEDELLVVYKDGSETTELLEDTNFQPIAGSNDSQAAELAQECADQINDETDAQVDVESAEFVSQSLGNEGAVLQVSLSEDQDIDQVAAEIQAQDDVAYVQKNYKYQLMTDENEGSVTNDEYLFFQYYLQPWASGTSNYGANLTNAWKAVTTDKSVTVAVLDTGVDSDHPDLVANLNKTYSSGVNGTYEDENGHGTHVAGIIAATANNGIGVAGTSYNASILAYKIMDKNGEISSKYLISAYAYLDKLIEKKKVTNLHVVNLSIGSYGALDKGLRKAIQELRDKHNVVTVCAGGNGDKLSKPFTSPIYPGDYPECVSVTALDSNGNNVDYSDYNQYKDISAPGKSIKSTYRGDSYAVMSGTSMAAPVVSGTMALLWAQWPKLTVSQAVKAIKATANPVNTQINDRGDKTGSAGAIDAAKAVNYVKTNYATKDIRKYSMSLSQSTYVYSGSQCRPTVKGLKLVDGLDYKITYSNNVRVGKATATISGIGLFNSKVTKTFNIKPMPTSLVSLTGDKAAFTVNWNTQTEETTGYQIQYATNSSFKSTSTTSVSKNTTKSLKIKNRKSKKKYYVRIRTYKTVSKTKYYSSWSSYKTVTTK